MCRYSDNDYGTHMVCLPCRWHQKAARVAPDPQRCPNCRRQLLPLGRDFKPPRRAAESQWRKVELLVASGVRFDSCGCDGPGPRPATLASAKALLARSRRSGVSLAALMGPSGSRFEFDVARNRRTGRGRGRPLTTARPRVEVST